MHSFSNCLLIEFIFLWFPSHTYYYCYYFLLSKAGFQKYHPKSFHSLLFLFHILAVFKAKKNSQLHQIFLGFFSIFQCHNQAPSNTKTTMQSLFHEIASCFIFPPKELSSLLFSKINSALQQWLVRRWRTPTVFLLYQTKKRGFLLLCFLPKNSFSSAFHAICIQVLVLTNCCLVIWV